jgi:uncharacterized protein (TIRG00374 family)
MFKKIKGSLIRVLVSLTALAVIAYSLRDSLAESFRILSQDVNWNWFILATLFYLFVQIIMAFRLFLLYKTQELVIRFGQTLYLCIVGLFFNLFLPSAVGGDVAKIYYTYKYTGKKIEAASAIFLDRLIGFLAIVLIAIGGLFFLKSNVDQSGIKFSVFFVTTLILLAVVFFMNPNFAKFFKGLKKMIPSEKVKLKLTELYMAISNCRHHRGLLLSGLLCSFVGQFFFIMTYFVASKSLHMEVQAGVFFVLIPMVSIISMTPSLGGLGVREAGLVYFFSMYAEPERALALSLLVNILIYGGGLVAGAIYSLGGGMLKSQNIVDIEKEVEKTL